MHQRIQADFYEHYGSNVKFETECEKEREEGHRHDEEYYQLQWLL